MKIVAFYLPQFHAIPENDKWWGKGFTEWVNVKKAVPLFKGHYQPKIPLNNNYYCLEDVNVMKQQAELAKKNRVDAFCFYHYWFNGKLLLEKPIENFYNENTINFEYCFSWANEPWTRSWDGKNKSVLIPQIYSGKEDIENHFNYLLKFFKDKRYLKIDNKPVFLLYRCNNISYLNEMILTWNQLAKKNGFNGIFFVETLTGFQKTKYSTNTDALVYMEPMYVIGKKSKIRKLFTAISDLMRLNRKERYDAVWKRVLKFEKISDKQFAGAFVDWDNSARKKKKNLVLVDGTVEKFKKYMSIQYKKAKDNESPFMFINAWNEWAEGTYLEPDDKHEYGYLNSIKEIVDDANN